MLDLVSKAPLVGSEELQKKVQGLMKVRERIQGSFGLFEFFMNGDWRYFNRKLYKLTAMLSPEEREEFQCDCRRVDYNEYLANYVKGMAIWVLKEDKVQPDTGMKQIVVKNYATKSLLKEVFHQNHHLFEKDSRIYEKKILSNDRFRQFSDNQGSLDLRRA